MIDGGLYSAVYGMLVGWVVRYDGGVWKPRPALGRCTGN